MTEPAPRCPVTGGQVRVQGRNVSTRVDTWRDSGYSDRMNGHEHDERTSAVYFSMARPNGIVLCDDCIDAAISRDPDLGLTLDLED